MKTIYVFFILLLSLYIISCGNRKDEKITEKNKNDTIGLYKKQNNDSSTNAQLKIKQENYKNYLNDIILFKSFKVQGEFSYKFFINNSELKIKNIDYAKLEMNYYISDTVKYKIIKSLKNNFDIEKTTNNRISIVKNYKNNPENLGFNFKDNIYISVVSGLVDEIENKNLEEYENFCIVFNIGSITVYIKETGSIEKILIVARNSKIFLLDKSDNVLASNKK